MLVWIFAILKVAWEASTWATYSSACESYFRFCKSHNIKTTLPPTTPLLLAWMVCLRFVHSLAASTSVTYLSGLKSICRISGLDTTPFEDFQLKYLMRGLKKTCPHRRRASPRLPITIWLLAMFIRTLGDSFEEKLLASVLAVGVHGLLRAGEYVSKNKKVSLTRADVRWFSDRAELNIQSKTDTFKVGTKVTIWKNSSICCPFTLLKWVFDNSADKHAFAPLFQNADGSPFTYAQLSLGVKALALACGLDPDRYKTHSCRFGGASSLAILGFQSHIIKTAGRWRSLSYQIYPHPSKLQMQQVSLALGQAAGTQEKEVFGGIPQEKMASLEWDDLSNITLFPTNAGGCQSVSWSSSS